MVDDPRAKEHQMCLGPNSDMIINLPDNIIDRILVRLPIREAVRTCVLSTKWRYKWTTITELVFHDNNELVQLSSPPHNNNNKDKLTNFIDRVLLLHTGFIHKFELSTTCCPISSSLIDAWILLLSRKNIKEFVLKFSGWKTYKLPSCFFSAQHITTLELHCCVVKPPPTFTGFSNLKSLVLYKTTLLDKNEVEYLISKCTLLERLTLDMIHGIVHLNICSPNLKYLCLSGTFQDFCLENTPLLSDVCIHTFYLRDEELKKFLQIETGNVVKVLSSLPNLRKFAATFYFLQFLAVGEIPEKLPFTCCHHLNSLTLELNFEDVNVMCVTLCLLNSSPNLRELNITSYPVSKRPGHGIENFWGKHTHIDWKMSSLQVVKITSCNEFKFKSGFEFIKLLLANSPMLEMLSIRPNPNERLELMAPGEKDILLLLLFHLLRVKRASPKAVIEFPGFCLQK